MKRGSEWGRWRRFSERLVCFSLVELLPLQKRVEFDRAGVEQRIHFPDEVVELVIVVVVTFDATVACPKVPRCRAARRLLGIGRMAFPAQIHAGEQDVAG